MDSGAFTEITTHGRFRSTVADYAAEVRRWAGIGTLDACVAQDYMCEPFALARTGLSVADHQRLTIDRYDELVDAAPGPYVLPVVQGFTPAEYVAHVDQYGARLAPGAWVGVGSICKRQGRPTVLAHVLQAVHDRRPDLQLHGFGVKVTGLRHGAVRHYLATADSLAWSYAARKQGRNGNDWREGEHFRLTIANAPARPWQDGLPLYAGSRCSDNTPGDRGVA
jgi:hypothetical protein